MNILKTLWKSSFMGGHPPRDATHRTEVAPSARCIDKRKYNTYNCGQQNNVPKDFAHRIPVTPSHIHLYTEHHKDKKDHEEPETKTFQEGRYGTMWRIASKKFVIHIATRTDITTPKTATPDASKYRPYHADKSDKANYRIKPTKNQVCKENPIKRRAFALEIAMKGFLLLHNEKYLFSKWLQR